MNDLWEKAVKKLTTYCAKGKRQQRLFSRLRDEGYLMKTGSSRNMPKQKYVEMGLFQIKETVISNPDGSVRMTKTTKVTGKGQQYFLNKYLKNKEAV